MSPENNPLEWSVDERDRIVGQQIQKTQRLMRALSAADAELRKASIARTEAEVAAREAIGSLLENLRPQYWQQIQEMGSLSPTANEQTLHTDFDEVD